MKPLLRFVFPFIIISFYLIGCSTTDFNQTAYPYIYNEETVLQKPVKRLVIANTNIGVPSKKYLNDYTKKIDKSVIEYLEAGGYKIVSQSIFDKAWRDAIRKYGSPYNPVTAQLNPAAFKRVMYTTLTALGDSGEVDAVVFTDLVERQVFFGSKLNRAAKWDGVSRKPRLKTGTQGVSVGFDWSQNVPAVSLAITIYRVDGEPLFKSMGGLEVSRELDAVNGNGRFVRREKMFTRSAHIREGVGLALHPFIIMKDYPGRE